MRSILFSLVLALSLLWGPVSHAATTVIPDPTVKALPMVKEMSVSVYIPSAAAPGEGLAVNIIYPPKPRYTEGAPVVVTVPGGEVSSGLEFSTHAAQAGFCEVRFAFPGGGKTGFASSGIYDFRGSNSQKALRDVLLFAAGKKRDTMGRTIDKLVPCKVANNTIGLIGWSNGGNTALITLAKYADQLKSVGYLVFYETPLGSMFYPACLGGAEDLVTNKNYRQGSAATGKILVDYRKLAYQPSGIKAKGTHKKLGLPEIEGVVFFDENGNHQWDEETEFAFPYCGDVGLQKQIYPPDVTDAMRRRKLFGDTWPKSIATYEESQKYFGERDGSFYLNDVAKAMPHLMVCVYGGQVDHLQRQEDHPHIPLNYNGWLSNRMKFARLNPDPIYVGSIALMNSRNFVDNKPNSSIDSDQISQFLEPKGLVADYVYIEAAISELSDRLRAKNTSESLAAPLVPYLNPAVAAAAAEAAKQAANKSK